MPNTKKRSLSESLIKTLSSSSNFALISFEKSTHLVLESLRKELKKEKTSFNVVKNTIFEKTVNKLSAKDKSFEKIRKTMFPLKDITVLLTFGGEWTEGLKHYFEKTKKNESFHFKFGLIDNELYDSKSLIKLSQLPSKNELMAKMLGIMKNPVARTTRALTFNMQKLVYVLTQKSKG